MGHDNGYKEPGARGDSVEGKEEKIPTGSAPTVSFRAEELMKSQSTIGDTAQSILSPCASRSSPGKSSFASDCCWVPRLVECDSTPIEACLSGTPGAAGPAAVSFGSFTGSPWWEGPTDEYLLDEH